ncbi:S-layer homology domain-containing protein [Saccharibacillus kuerlensis]|uniref:S-layer homology domain-containing protein n=1 Tax=Saccharibacillus kuerlensis TaxID=459527 RepID=UPI00035E9324|nr:S-layer homology domain-containing protein [Saccharibacillus kuerlensis]
MKKSWMKRAGLALAAVLTAGAVWGTGYAPDVQAASSAFSDVKAGHWAESAIAKGVSKGYVDGYTNGTFKPDASVTRAEFVKMVVSAMKLETKEASGKWYVPYVDAAASKGLYATSDFANSEATWNKTMTREEMARVAARAIGEKTSENDKWMYLATKEGLIKGMGKAQLAPKGLTTRAQSVVIIERILTSNAGGNLDSDLYATGAAEIMWHGTNIFTVMPEMFVTPESDWKNKGKTGIEDMWNEKNMTITSKDGLYQAKLDALIAIDMADPNDPNRALLGDINTLKWFNGNQMMKNPIKGNTNTYVIYFKSKQVFNKDRTRYVNRTFAQFQVTGFGNVDGDAYAAGKLNKAAYVYRNQMGDVPAVIVPKSGTVQGMNDISIVLQTPASGTWFKNVDLLRLRGIK